MEYSYPPPTDEWAFEIFSMRFLKVHWPDSEPQRYGRRGQSQQGVDIIDESGVIPLRAAQCKFKSPGHFLAEGEVTAEVEKAKQFTPAIGHYFILTTSERSTDVQRTVVQLNQEHRQQSLFRITLLTWDRIEEILRENPELWSLCIDPPVQRAIGPVYREVTAISRRLDLLIPSAAEDEYDARLESARQRLDEHDRQAAKIILRQLRSNNWPDLSERQRFLALTYLAKIACTEGKWSEAGHFYLAAKPHQPDDERAKINEVLGHELLGERELAHQMTRELADAYPHSSRPWAIFCRTAPDATTAVEVDQELPSHARADTEVLVALAMRALRHQDWENAVRFAQDATQGDQEWPAPWLILGQARLHQEVDDGLKPITGKLVTENPSVLRDVIYLFDRAIDIAERTQNEYLTIQSLLERGKAKRIAGADDEADEDFVKAHNLAPHDSEVAYHYGQHLFQRGRVDAAVSLLREAVNSGAGGDAAFMLALALRSQDESRHRSEWTRWAIETAGDPQAFHQLDAAEFAVDALIEQDRIVEAEDLVDRLAQETLPVIATEALRTRLNIARGNREQAIQLAASANEQVSHISEARLVRMVAEAYTRLGDHGTALPLWKRVAEETRHIADVWKLIETARRVGQYEVLRRVCSEWREAGVSDSTLLNAELDVLERFAPHEALEVLQHEVEQHPDDALIRLRLACLALRLDRPELVCRDPSKFPAPTQAGPRNGTYVVQVLAGVGEFEVALKYAYNLLRSNQNSPIANSSLAFLVIGSNVPDDLLSPPDSVVAGVAVSFIEEGTNDIQWRVIEDHPDGPTFPEDINPDHGLARRLLGLHPGDTFVLAGDDVDGRRATVKEVVSKYVYRANKCMSDWQIRFPDEPGIELFRVSTVERPDGTDLPDVLPMVRRVHARRRYINKTLSHYRESLASINLIAEHIGSHFADAMIHLASSDDIALRCCDSNIEVFQEAINLTAGASVLVLDLSAIVTLTILKLDQRLGEFPAQLVVSADTLRELRTLRDDRRRLERTSGWLAPAESDIGLRMIKSSEEERRHGRERIEELIERVTAAVNSLDCGELADLPPDQRNEIIECYGQHGAESIVLARSPGHILWTDDLTVALCGQEVFGIRRVWTQAVLASLLAQGFLDNQEYQAASARLLGYNYSSTRFDYQTLLAAASIADWAPGVWPLKQALEPLAEVADQQTKFVVAELFIREIITQPVKHPRHNAVVMAVLDKIATGPQGVAGVEALRRNVPHLFGLDALAAEEATDCINRWLANQRIGRHIIH